jgi:hypothetical protein
LNTRSRTLDGEPAYELIYTDTIKDEANGDDIDLETWEIGTIIGNNYITLYLQQKQQNFPTYYQL